MNFTPEQLRQLGVTPEQLTTTLAALEADQAALETRYQAERAALDERRIWLETVLAALAPVTPGD